MSRTLIVGAGGLVGSLCRYWMAGVVQQLTGFEFPLGTLAVNVLGSFVIGLVFTLSLERGLLDANARLLLTTGFCGGFTTMSTFSFETVALLRDGSAVAAFGNIAGTLILCLAAVWLGDVTARML